MTTFYGQYLRKYINEQGRAEIVLELDSHLDGQLVGGLEKGVLYRFKTIEIKSKRSLQQNNLMWELIHEISVSRNSELATNDDDWNVYIEALEKAQAKFTFIAIKPEALKLLKDNFRAVKELNKFTTEKGVEMVQCKVFYGSSKMDVQEMAKLIDTVIMMAQEEGIDIRANEYE